jgi:ABC-2 type transport system ATP-binding protein
VNQPPALHELTAIPGVTRAEAAGENLFRVHVAAGTDPTAQIVALAAERQWALHQIAPAQTNLEDVFVNLTTQDALNGERAA